MFNICIVVPTPKGDYLPQRLQGTKVHEI